MRVRLGHDALQMRADRRWGNPEPRATLASLLAIAAASSCTSTTKRGETSGISSEAARGAMTELLRLSR